MTSRWARRDGRSWLIWLCLAVVGAIALPAAGQVTVDCRLRAKRVRDPYGLVNMATRRSVRLPGKPDRMKDVPEKVPSGASYFEIQLAGRAVTGVVYKVRFGFGKTELYLDVDGDGSFRDEKRIAGAPAEPYQPDPTKRRPIPQSEVTLRDDSGERPLRFNVAVFPELDTMFRPATYQVGKIELDRTVYDVALVDGDFDGRYNTLFSPPMENVAGVQCDLIAVDLNRNGQFDCPGDYNPLGEAVPLGTMLPVHGQYYRVRVSPDGASLEMERVTPQFGRLDFGGTQVQAVLWSDVGRHLIGGSERNHSLPAGMYGALSMEVTATNGQGTDWTFTSRRRTGPAGRFEIRPGQTTSLNLGPPFHLASTLEQTKDTIVIGLDLLGRGGAVYTPVTVRHGLGLPEPTLKVVSESGQTLYSGRFKYG